MVKQLNTWLDLYPGPHYQIPFINSDDIGHHRREAEFADAKYNAFKNLLNVEVDPKKRQAYAFLADYYAILTKIHRDRHAAVSV